MKPINNVATIIKIFFVVLMMLLVFSSPDGLTIAEGAILQQTCNGLLSCEGKLCYRCPLWFRPI